MRLPLSIKDLEIGKVYNSGWLIEGNKLETNHRLYSIPTTYCDKDIVVISTLCFVILDIQITNNLDSWCKIITKNGQIGWVLFLGGFDKFCRIS